MANENVPFSSITYLKSLGYDIKAIGIDDPSISDERVMKIAIEEERAIITYDSDYGELIFKKGFKPSAGVIFIRIQPETPLDTARIIEGLQETDITFENSLTVVDKNSIRQKKY